jgi:hypothetical protein
MADPRDAEADTRPDEEEEEDEFDMEGLDDDGGMDLMDALGNFLSTDEGDSIANVLGGIKTQLEMQNKILVKIFGVLNKTA